MKKGPLMTHAEHANAKKPNGPLRTLTEIASEFGVHPSVLNHIMGTAKVAPPAKWSQLRPAYSPRTTYYELNAMRAWWAKYRESKKAA